MYARKRCRIDVGGDVDGGATGGENADVLERDVIFFLFSLFIFFLFLPPSRRERSRVSAHDTSLSLVFFTFRVVTGECVVRTR